MAISPQERYQQEREKRVNARGLAQYLDRTSGAKYGFNVDPWVSSGTPIHRPVPDGGHCKIVIFGAGLAGLLSAVRCLETGAAKSAGDILMVDPAGGFGGTWWWNRFPGLMCDVESYIYLPLLEETGYMPKRKYASGEEIRSYLDLVADQYQLRDRAMFQTSGKTLTWETDHWVCEVVESPNGKTGDTVTVHADYVILACGLFTYPKLPDVPGLDAFQGQMLHTARWNYQITGGSPTEPALTKLAGKKVAIVGTGATAIQTVPAVAPYVGELNVFQRTPAAVDVRDNRDTDPVEWKTKIASKKGWQKERVENFQAWVENGDERPEVDLVDDALSRMPSIAAGSGTPRAVKLEEIQQYVEKMHELDLPRQERIRQRVLDVVQNQETAKKLQAWYPGWCKRACIHDEYLAAFNNPHVHLVDTEGRGVQALTANGIVVGGREYATDVIIWSTGYGNPGTESVAGKAGMAVIGKSKGDMESCFKRGDLNTLHGIMGHDFPNLFSFSLAQAAIGPNQTQRMSGTSEQIGHIIATAERKVGGRATIEPTAEACEQWANKVASHAHMLASMGGCTPSYLNLEGQVDRLSQEEMMKAARNGVWGQGYTAYSRILSHWRTGDDLEGIEVKAV